MKKLFYFIAILAITFVSCNKNENDIDETQAKTNPDALYAKTEYNLDMRDFAMAVNEAVNTNKSFRRLVKEEALKKFDGDYDILLSNVVEKQVSHNNIDNGISTPNKVKANFTVRDLLEDAYYTLNEKNKLQGVKAKQLVKSSTSRQNVSAVQQTLIDELIEEYPELQISVPVHAEDLEDESYIPPVTFIPEEVDEKSTKYLPLIDSDGIKSIEAQIEPDNAIIVIGMNERIPLPEIVSVPPPPPTDLSATATSTGILLTWNKATDANSLNTLGYNIYRKASNSSSNVYNKIGNTVGLNNVSYPDMQITYGSAYSYYITAYNSDSESEPTVQIPAFAPAIQSPQHLMVATASAAKTLDIEWDATTIGESYEIYRRKTGEIYFSKIADNYGLHNNFYTDTQLEGGSVYSYKVRAKNSASAYSSWSSTMSMHASDRQLDSELKVSSVYFPNKGDVEPWYRGDPELLLVVTGSIGANSSTIVCNSGMIQTSHVSNKKWYTLNLQVTPHWNPNSTGSVYVFEWSEMDGGSKTTYTVSSSYEDKLDNNATVKSGSNITYESNEGNDKIGLLPVAWWESASTEYKCTNMYWKLN